MRELRKDVAEIKAAIHSKAYSHVAAAPPPTAVSAKTTKPTPRELESARRGAEPRIVLKTQHLPEQHPARAEVPSQLLQRIAPHLSAQLQTQALSVGRLHSGDLKISVASKAEENRVLDEANEEWLRLAFDPEEVSPEVRRPLFPEHKTIAVHGVPFYLGNDGIKADVERVHGIIITSARFFLGQHRRESLQKSNKRQFGSAAVAFKTQEDRDRFLKSGKISCGISRCTVEPYLSRTHPAMREMPTAWSRRALLQKTAVGHPSWLPVGDSGPTQYNLDYPRDTPLPPHPRVVIYINKDLQTANVSVVGVPHPDLVTVNIDLQGRPQQASAEDGVEPEISAISITNIYNPNRSADSIAPLAATFEAVGQDRHHLVLGNFNTHHSLWESKVHGSSRFAQKWLDAIEQLDLHLLTPRDCPTYESREGRYSTIDLAFATEELAGRLIQCISLCDREPGDGSDHLPVATTLNLAPVTKVWPVRFNLQKCDVKRLGREVELAWKEVVDGLPPIRAAEGVECWAAALQGAVVHGLEESAPLLRSCSRSQPWFDHGASRAQMNKARREWQAKRKRVVELGEPNDDTLLEVEEYRLRFLLLQREHYASIRRAKKNHRRQTLANASGGDIWRLASSGKGGGGGQGSNGRTSGYAGGRTGAPSPSQGANPASWSLASKGAGAR
ncbi:unnamed protein product [Tilletia controversa]|nr:unnamed protein product [Tilletia controversa]